MAAAADDDERTGYGARRGWRAPKGSGSPGPAARSRKRDRRTASPAVPADPTDDDGPRPGTTAAAVASLLHLRPAEAAALAREPLPAPGAPDALTGTLRALGRLLDAARTTAETARRRADEAADHRARDAERARERLTRAAEAERRQRAKAEAEQSSRQRLAGELERAHARLAQVTAERDRLRQEAADDGGARAAEATPGGEGPREAGATPGGHRPRAADATPGGHGPPASGATSGGDGAAVAGLLARVADLEDQLTARAVALEELTDRREQAEAQRDHLLTVARRLRRQAIEAGATGVELVDPEDTELLQEDELPEVRTVLEAVELAAAHAQHLIYTDRAFASARTAPYEEPRKLLRDLVALDRVAAAWQVPSGIGRPIRDVAVEQLLDWADDVSETARSQNAREYRFAHRGRPLWAGPHVRVATGRGLQRTCRVYLALVKGGEADLAGLPRGVYVGPVGRHLSDSKSG